MAEQFQPIEAFEDDPDCPPFILDAVRRKRGLRFTEDWFADAACETLARLARKVSNLDGLIVEVGSWEGKSTIALANAVHPSMVYAVDTWKGSLNEESWHLAKQRDVYAQFLTNIAAATKGNVYPQRMGWRRWFHETEGAIRFCFIDAEHSYKEVRENIEVVLPRMVPGGILCGDDVHHPPVLTAVIDTLGEHTPTIGPLWVHVCPS